MIISNTTKKEIIGDKLKITTTMVTIHNLQDYLTEKQTALENVVASANTVFADLQEVAGIASDPTPTPEPVPEPTPEPVPEPTPTTDETVLGTTTETPLSEPTGTVGNTLTS